MSLRAGWAPSCRKGPWGVKRVRRRVLEVVGEEMKKRDGESEEFYYNRLRAKLHNWRGIGGRPEVLRLLREGVPVLFEHGAPPPRRAKAYPVTREQEAWFWGPGGPKGEPGGEGVVCLPETLFS